MAGILSDLGLWAAVAGASFALIILANILVSLAGSRIGMDRSPRARKAVILVMAFLCLVLALSLIPLMVGAVLGFQQGSRAVPAVAFALSHQDDIVLAVWLLMLCGSALAIPAMMRDPGFDA